MVMPGDNTSMQVDLLAPIALEKGVRFAIREGGHTVGSGTIMEIVDHGRVSDSGLGFGDPRSRRRIPTDSPDD